MNREKIRGARREGSLKRSSSLSEMRSRADDAAERADVDVLRGLALNWAAALAASCVVMSSSRESPMSCSSMTLSVSRREYVGQDLKDERNAARASSFRRRGGRSPPAGVGGMSATACQIRAVAVFRGPEDDGGRRRVRAVGSRGDSPGASRASQMLSASISSRRSTRPPASVGWWIVRMPTAAAALMFSELSSTKRASWAPISVASRTAWK